MIVVDHVQNTDQFHEQFNIRVEKLILLFKKKKNLIMAISWRSRLALTANDLLNPLQHTWLISSSPLIEHREKPLLIKPTAG